MLESEFAHLIAQRAAAIRRVDLETLVERLPNIHARVERYHFREYPHLPDQVEFLALLVEDAAHGLHQHLPFAVLAEAAVALGYLLDSQDLIPDEVPGIGLLDDAMIISLVLRRHQALLRDHPRACKLRWPVPAVRFESVFAQEVRALAAQPVHLPAE